MDVSFTVSIKVFGLCYSHCKRRSVTAVGPNHEEKREHLPNLPQ
jgi:hypothetical protein